MKKVTMNPGTVMAYCPFIVKNEHLKNAVIGSLVFLAKNIHAAVQSTMFFAVKQSLVQSKLLNWRGLSFSMIFAKFAGFCR